MVVFLDYEVRRVAQAKQKSSSRDGQGLERDWKKQLRKLCYGWMIGNWMGKEKKREKAAGARGRVALLKFCAVLFESNFCLV